MARIIDGKSIAAALRGEVATLVQGLQDRFGKVPTLAVVLVGARKDSQTYVRMKKRACAEVGILSREVDLPVDATEAAVVATVRELNEDPTVHGILVQLPLPNHINEATVLEEISFNKDVDGLHPLNVGYLWLHGRTPKFVACTPMGCIELLKRSDVEIAGKRAVVLGRSNIVGTPIAALLQQENATVTVCHSRTVDIPGIVREADILIAAIGKPNFVQADWVKPGAAIIDVGINSVDDESAPRGYRLVGDVDFDACSKVAGAITPVPGGVGPMTIAMLLKNTVCGASDTFEAAAASEPGASE